MMSPAGIPTDRFSDGVGQLRDREYVDTAAHGQHHQAAVTVGGDGQSGACG